MRTCTPWVHPAGQSSRHGPAAAAEGWASQPAPEPPPARALPTPAPARTLGLASCRCLGVPCSAALLDYCAGARPPCAPGLGAACGWLCRALRRASVSAAECSGAGVSKGCRRQVDPLAHVKIAALVACLTRTGRADKLTADRYKLCMRAPVWGWLQQGLHASIAPALEEPGPRLASARWPRRPRAPLLPTGLCQQPTPGALCHHRRTAARQLQRPRRLPWQPRSKLPRM